MSLENYSPEAIEELAALSKRLSEDPKTRKSFLRLAKEVNPDLPVPELEMEEVVNQRVSASEQRVADLEKQLRAREVRDELNRRRSKLKESGYAQSDDDILEIEKLMTEKGIANHETAADYWRHMKQSAVPTSAVALSFIQCKAYHFENTCTCSTKSKCPCIPLMIC